ncbi:DUF6660 family protein [Maribacter forsetii]|uniref:DUF6660 family protein n=1 Tax=Maribacter forsetii TaxID=444515 RepID=UPI0005697FDD|nr:DUF6660 family protein [Maribacter forsetii]
MKILCSILSLYVFLLSTVPCCWDDNCNDEEKTELTENHSKDQQDDGCNTCSPFFSCGTCSGFVFINYSINFKKVHITKTKLVSVYKSKFASNFFAKIWQPPKLI